jgi:hypothetical protein
MSPQLVIALFLIAQVCDGLLTYAAVGMFGTVAEGNPLIVAWMGLVGPGSALLGAKVLAIGCGLMLYAIGTYRVLLGLTVFYGAAAVGPWLAIFHQL